MCSIDTNNLQTNHENSRTISYKPEDLLRDNSYPENVPPDWASMTGWCIHSSKRPLISPSKPENAATLHDVAASNCFGFITSSLNEVCIIDIDDTFPSASGIKDLPDDIQKLISRTYTEVSLSGKGLHVVFELEGKALFWPKRAYIKAPQGTFKGQLSLRRNFMVVTGKALPFELAPVRELARLQTDELPETFILAIKDQETRDKEDWDKVREAVKDSTVVQEQLNSINVPKMKQIKVAIQAIAPNQSDSVVKAYEKVTGQEYEHYTFWLTMGMALHSWGQDANSMTVAYAMFLEWSKRDLKGYTGEAAVEEKWKSFTTAQSEAITWKTILALALELAFDYPRRVVKSGSLTPYPQINEYCNFEYLLDRYNIKLFPTDGAGYFVTGDQDIVEHYFNSSKADKLLGLNGPYSLQALQAATVRLCQDSQWKGLSTTATLCGIWLQQKHDTLDIFKRWIDTPEDELDEDLQYMATPTGNIYMSSLPDENSTFDYINDCITWNTEKQSPELSKNMLFKTMMQLMKFRVDFKLPFDDNGGMLAFIGPENTRKTTFFKMMLPRKLAFLRKEINMQIGSDKGIRDFLRYLGSKAIIQIDEFEGFMDHKKHGPILKAIISGNDVSLTDIYQSSETIMPRKAIIVGTSNETRHALSRNGSRRMWLAEVKGVDTTRLLRFNWHKFYRNLMVEFTNKLKENEQPWLLNQRQVELVTEQNKNLSAGSDLDIALYEAFPYNDKFPFERIDELITSVQSDKSGYLYTTSQVASVLKFRGVQVRLAHLERCLERFCMDYTMAPKEQIDLKYPKAMFKSGRLHQGLRKNGQYNYSKWILPKID